MRLVRHTGYWQPGKPYLDAVEFVLAMPKVTQRFKLEKGDLDFVREFSQPDSTARGHALDASAHLLAHEVAARLDLACPAVAATFRARVTQLDTDRHEQYVEELLQRSLDLRAADFGPPDLQPLTTSA